MRKLHKMIPALALTAVLIGASAAGSAATASTPPFGEPVLEEIALQPVSSPSGHYETSVGVLVSTEDPQVAAGNTEIERLALAEMRAAEIVSELSDYEIGLLRSDQKVSIEADPERGVYTAVTSDADMISPFALTVSYGCTAGSTNTTCLQAIPTTGVKLTGSGETSWLWYQGGVYRVFAPTNRTTNFTTSSSSTVVWVFSAGEDVTFSPTALIDWVRHP